LELAFILHARPYSNSSLLLDCLTLEQGRLTAIAKGVKSQRVKNKSAILQPFTPLQIKWSGRGEVKTLTTYEAAGNPIALQGKRLYCGIYINELLSRLLERGEPNPKLFGQYSAVLESLQTVTEVEDALRRFEVFLLAELGYGIELGWDGRNECSVSESLQYAYVFEQGPVAVKQATKNTVSGSTLIALSAGQPLEKHQLIEARNLMRNMLSHYLGDKPLKSRELFIDGSKLNKKNK